MVDHPAGTVTFLLTDIEGSTRLWEADPAVMREALAAHDRILRSAVDAAGGWLFKHTGDGVCAAFASAPDAVAAAVHAQRRLDLPVRMGLATGTAELRDEDYFGPVVNRAARVMAAGHGGQILVAAGTAGLVADEVVLVDLGEHSLRDLSGVHRIFQVRAEGLRVEFPPLRTLDAVPGNLAVPTSSFVGRAAAIKELVAKVRTARLVTLTGVGGVGKTRLALRAAGELVAEFPDGVWLVELGPLGEPAALADVVATGLGVTPQAGRSVTDSIAEALSGRRLLLVLDNCEHVLDAAAGLIDTILANTTTVKVIATSREGLRVGAEQLWPVPSLGMEGGAAEAVELFVERARAVQPTFNLDHEADAEAVALICRRLDGNALAIELAAARMVSMTPIDVRDRLDDRFRLLASGRRGEERHQTLRQAVAWSYDLLTDDERLVLGPCAIFAGGFDLPAATAVCDGFDEYTVLDMLDSLVHKSLVTVAQSGGHARYGLLETIRQFAEEHLAATDHISEVRGRHARYFAARAIAYWDIWDGPRQRIASEWAETEFANLRSGFRWAADHHDVVTATAIAAHTPQLTMELLHFESIGWAEELIDAASVADVSQLPRLYNAASICTYTGRPETAVGYAQKAVALETDPRYDGFRPGWSTMWQGLAHLYAGRIERCLDLWSDMAADPQPGFRRVNGMALMLWLLPAVGRAAEAMKVADEYLAAARAYGNPAGIAIALAGYGRAFADTDPDRALAAYREGLEHARKHRVLLQEAIIARDAAGLEARHGRRDDALELFDSTIATYHRVGNHPGLAITLADLAVFFDRTVQSDIAATIYGSSTRYQSIVAAPGLPGVVEHLRAVLGDTLFDRCVETGAALDFGDAVAYARHQIRLARQPKDPPV